jgi:hypothetical protein
MVNLGLGDLVEGHEVSVKKLRQFVQEASCECGWWSRGESGHVSTERKIHLQQAVLDGARVIRRHGRTDAR